MAQYKVVMLYSDGTQEELDEIFDTEEEADEAGMQACSDYREGCEIMNLSNPGDYPLYDDDDVDYEIIEIDE